ncbi:DUF1546-domain-containing protein [Sodiomyces alkalinus F11]|uniref:TBP-associated factor 6 n=1 Tax=Sodiomyces alkalinus (strain CBS 110278 / VKM F-3762 / F11) TaxID=1314773 RepID=A0A3N2PX05_SODAK|nr:DUF1546-domain-containing protein [Sodiomyces alkalinus F11]ROT39053.1 DUF1546-domain-containing protein [Sodiomyces alkalinus F11]
MATQPPQAQQPQQARPQQAQNPPETKLLWNPDNVKDVAESVGISVLGDDALRVLTQDAEYRIGQVVVEALRFMRAARRTTLLIADLSQALRVLDVEPLYGYDSTRPLRYGEASLGPGQPLFYIEDEEVDFEKLINAPLPRVPRDMNFTAHWLAVEGVQPAIPQNPSTSSSSGPDASGRSHDHLLPKGPGANPAAAALAGLDNVTVRPAVKHVVSNELVLYFDKVQEALMEDNPDEEVVRLRHAALDSVRADPGLHQLVPYFVNLICNNVTHRLDDTFVLLRSMELAEALVRNPHLFLDPYANALAAPVLTCLLSRRVGSDDDPDAPRDQYLLREFSASLLGLIARRYAASNHLLRPKLVRTCLKYFMDPDKPPASHFGAITGLAAAGGPEAVRILVVKYLRPYSDEILQRVRDRNEANGLHFEALTGAIVKAIAAIAEEEGSSSEKTKSPGPVNGEGITAADRAQLVEFIGPILGTRIAQLGNKRLVEQVLDVRNIQ